MKEGEIKKKQNTMAVYKSPNDISGRGNSKSVFLAGSIEMDTAINWQEKCEIELQEKFTVFNPRRESWNSSWEQKITNEKFKEQVDWELDALEQADIIILFFANNTKSPISLLEFGLYAKSNKLLVVCEEGFWRKGNVDIVCEKYSIKQFENLEDIFTDLKENE